MAPARKRKVADEQSLSDAPKSKKSASSGSQPAITTKSMIPSTDTPNFSICSWNVNGIRACLKNGGISFITKSGADVFCIQETKCADLDVPSEVKHIKGYHSYFQSTEAKGGYAGVALYSKIEPINVTFGMGIAKHDDEGRLITAEYESFYLVSAYVPNSGQGLKRLKYRHMEWDVDFLAYLKKLDAKKPVIYTGDLNVAHQEIDLKNPTSNRNKTPGFCDEERENFSQLLDAGFTDTLRAMHADKEGAYTFWSYRGNARAKGIGWRLDYFVVSDRLTSLVCDSLIHNAVTGSDHCPIELKLCLPT